MRIDRLIALAGLTAFIAWCFRRNEQARAAGRQAREEIGRWEAEGGNVLAFAAATPMPYPPGGDPNVRH
jgi:hypothetical protein